MSRRMVLVVGVIVFLLWVAGAALPWWWVGSGAGTGNWAERGQFGDQFGAVNALFSGLAFAGVIYAVLLQRQELELQRRELELTRQELKRTAEAQDQAQRALVDQAASSARSVEIVYRQWKAERLSTLVPLQIGIDEALQGTWFMEQQLHDLLGRPSPGFGSVVLHEPSLGETRERARHISRELFDALGAAAGSLTLATRLSNKQQDGRTPQDSWREALHQLATAKEKLEAAMALTLPFVAELETD